MPFTMITLKKVPDSLRGDLTRWMQEVSTGVYVGNFNSKVREYLWKRVTDTIGKGEAIICYSCRNEIGYSFSTCNSEREVIDHDGIPLVMIPVNNAAEENAQDKQYGYSNASKYHQALRKVKNQDASVLQKGTDEVDQVSLDATNKQMTPDLVFLDIETTGLDAENDRIIEIGAVKVSDGIRSEFHRMICTDVPISNKIRDLTGITDDMLRHGTVLESSLQDLATFIQGTVLVGYNISFDMRFLNRALEQYSLGHIHNKIVELISEAKKRNSFQVNYKFETTLKEYGIKPPVLHRALEDARLMYQLYRQMGLE